MRVVRDVLLVPIGILLFLAAFFVVLPYFGTGAAGSEVSARGTAVAQQCRFAGPIAKSSAPKRENVIGFGWICRARVHWNDGSVETREVSGSQLTGEDVGNSVDVVERQIDYSKGSDTRPQIYRADFEPHVLLAWGSVLATCLLGFVFAALGFSGLSRIFSKKGVPVE
ncbi:hypothetical protein SAMN04487904_102494 [Actinopolyspora lacussalsi subsp. righensis]|uniref:Uncharacterized protein n=1 Tax=Actinopolyspora righensis TaxID=995060 RepID=A0A1I6YFG8_9ACTN|nr:DUF6346 domain-containing protein [Actinopolyspora righensis]SFT49243.1 hypothetical protein SAMN04487904_102494 [Actinopolyspora righensis]